MTFKNPPPPPAAAPAVSASAPLPRSRRQPPILKGPAKFGEVAGRTAAECAAVCCCCPCGLVNLLVCAVVKLPAGLCRRAYVRRRRRRRMKRKAALLMEPSAVGSSDDGGGSGGDEMKERWGISTVAAAAAASEHTAEVVAIEKEMWDAFYGTGFWRSPSQREEDQKIIGNC